MHRQSVLWTYLGVSAEGSNINLSSCNGAVRIYNDCQEGVAELLIDGLGAAVDARQPAAVARMTVIPAHHILQTPHYLPSQHNDRVRCCRAQVPRPPCP
jgi:hypothetical protein